MKKIIILICAVFLIGCGGSKKLNFEKYIKYIDHGYITVVGVAKEGKAGAMVEVDSIHHYFIQGLGSWPENAYGKKIRAQGKWMTIDKRELANKYSYIQGLRIREILEKAKWEIVE